MTAVLLHLCLISTPTHNASGLVHSDLTSMNIGVDTSRHSNTTLIVAAVYVVSQMIFLVASLRIGICQKTGTRKCLVLFVAAWIAVILMLFWFYHGSIDATHETTFKLGFPGPTTWMLYVVWPTPVVMILVYCFKYSEWFYPKESRERFEELIRTNNDRQS